MKRVFAALLCLCLLLGMAGCVKEEEKTITFSVTHADGTTKDFEITTTGKTLADALLQEGLVVESASSAGLYDVVDGEKADWSDGEAWWQFLADGTALMVGIAETEIADGEAYSAVFTRGFE